MNIITIGFISLIAIIILIVIRFFINKLNIKIETDRNLNINRLPVRRANNTSAPVRANHTSVSTSNHRPLPARYNNISIFMYPKCPVDRSRNFQGMPQKVFYNAEIGCYYCKYGHYFKG